MIKIALIGGGNLAWHLANIFAKTKGVELSFMYNKTIGPIQEFEKVTCITDEINSIKNVDLIIICVTDSAISEVSNFIENNNTLIVHTSGATSLNVLNKHNHRGVFYPLQSFNKNRKIDFDKIPICIETNQIEDYLLLESLAKLLSSQVIQIDSSQREKIHLSAVFVNNFVNHLYFLGYDFLEQNLIDPNILFPLIKETAQRVKKVSPYNAQTGPAKRKDTNTIENHLKLLEGLEIKTIYEILSNSIADTYAKKL